MDSSPPRPSNTVPIRLTLSPDEATDRNLPKTPSPACEGAKAPAAPPKIVTAEELGTLLGLCPSQTPPEQPRKTPSMTRDSQVGTVLIVAALGLALWTSRPTSDPPAKPDPRADASDEKFLELIGERITNGYYLKNGYYLDGTGSPPSTAPTSLEASAPASAPATTATEIPDFFEPAAAPPSGPAAVPAGRTAMTPTAVSQMASASIVRVRVSGLVKLGTAPQGTGDEFRRFEKVGTGFVIDDAGHIVTNEHVARTEGISWADPTGPNRPTIEVVTPAQISYRAELVGLDKDSDLAVLKMIEGPKLPALRFADPASIEVLEEVIAIGFALGLHGTPTHTKGVVSALERSYLNGYFSGAIQTDAAINHGNSGGPLLDMEGNVIGVNTAQELGRAAETREAVPDPVQGIFYARSSKTAMPVVQMLIDQHGVRRASLGIETIPIPQTLESRVREGVCVASPQGVSFSDLLSKRLQREDIITYVGGYPISCLGDLKNALLLLRPGQTVQVTVFRRFLPIALNFDVKLQ
jgi:S1-C subfamily serine protease